MKRAMIVACLIICMAAVSILSLYKVYDTRTVMTYKVNTVLDAIELGDRELIQQRVEDLSDYWVRQERILIHYIRHGQIESLTLSVSRLKSFAANEDTTTHLQAELSTIQWQVDSMWESEVPTLSNVF